MIGCSIILAHPLILDYVKKDSRGKASSFQGVGYTVGEVFAIAVLLNLTVELKPAYAFSIAGSCVMLTGIITLFLVKERKVKRNKSDKFTQVAKAIYDAQQSENNADGSV